MIKALENAGDNRCLEKGHEKKLQQIEQRQGDQPQKTDKENRLYFFRIHDARILDISKLTIWLLDD